jgi:hypothetical protein
VVVFCSLWCTNRGHYFETYSTPFRRVVGLVVDVPWLLRVQFSILNSAGQQIGHVNRANMKIKDTYEIRIDDDSLDMRVAAAMGVAVDAFMNR